MARRVALEIEILLRVAEAARFEGCICGYG